ncbi:adenylate/guanylate cyclase domain-containing protein [Pontixanthobacter gangjinensis]|uniref:CHASE2 domain-containing protein n=1 Tax=Pontixanthobacter gangjinensis TaxID=1028742 RepID=A0A6I4SQE6_9SPHN|nr:adenylate/guanylate cyclase domain-containing protein [Pontixanthobacter gangjinensis]MXO56802.1 CHASE2 domain-containing protein [Pontixanthobacter gangjinensis]
MVRDFIAASAERIKSGPVIVGLLVVAAVAALQFAAVPVFDRLGLWVFDSYQRAAPRVYEDAAVRIVDIDEESIERFGQWPWPRTEIARLTQRLSDAGAAAIAFDIVFSEADRTSPEQIADQLRLGEGNEALAARLAGLPSNDDALADVFAMSPVVGGFFLLKEDRGTALELPAGMAVLGSPPVEVEQYSGSVQSLPILQDAAAGLGSLSIIGDEDGIIRKAPLLFSHRGQLVPSLSLEALRVALGAQSVLIKTSDGSGETAGATGAVVSIRVGDFEVPTTASGELLSRFTKPEPARTIPAWQILSKENSADQLAEQVEGQIVFVGASATGLRDLIATPLSDREAGVTVHAQAAEQIILGEYLSRPDWARGAEFLLVILMGGALALLLPKLGAVIGALVGFAGTASVYSGSWFAFDNWQYLLDPTYPVIALVLVYGVQTLLSFRHEEQQRAYIRGAFDRYLSPEMVRQISANPEKLELGGEEREMTVMFCDIRGFSRISEQYDPKEVINFLTGFLTPMCDILLERKATVDKFIGDAILAFWNAPLDDPDQFRNGARASLQMVAALEQLNLDMPAKPGQVWPPDVKIGIGMNAGLCCVGNMGSKQRLSYSLIGDTVNIASRFEGLTKQYGVSILIGSALADQLDGFALLELDRVKVVGREAPDTIFALLGDELFATGETYQSLTEHHSTFLFAYRQQDWALATATLDEFGAVYNDVGLSALAQIYRERVKHLSDHQKIANWDGVFAATQK